jgi:glycosyltransferase involved in cell wall biosynthesis
MEKQSDIIIVGIQPWDIEIGSNCKNMAIELSKKQRVLYVNSCLDRITALKNKNSEAVKKRLSVIKSKQNLLEQINPNLWVLTPACLLESIQFLPTGLFSFFNKINNSRFANAIQKAQAALNFNEFILLNDSDMFRSFHLKELLKPSKYIYYTRDNLMTVPYWKKHGMKFEKELMQKADFVLGNSPFLIAEAKKHNPHSYFIGQGCDVSDFMKVPSEKPSDLQHIQGPIVGYTGLLSSRRLDIDLLIFLAKREQNLNFVLIGPEESCFKNSALHQLPNVFFLGNKSPESLPAYIHHFDICINPQIVNDLTEANYPRKIDEYLAVGKPIVATKTPTMEIFNEVVYLAHEKENFLTFIKQALAENSIEKTVLRQKEALKHTWENCIQLFWKSIQTS